MPVAADEAVTGPVKGRGAARDGQAFGDQVQSLLGAWFAGASAVEAVEALEGEHAPIGRARPARGKAPEGETAEIRPAASDTEPALPAFAATVVDQTAWMRPAVGLTFTAPQPALDPGPVAVSAGPALVAPPAFDTGSDTAAVDPLVQVQAPRAGITVEIDAEPQQAPQPMPPLQRLEQAPAPENGTGHAPVARAIEQVRRHVEPLEATTVLAAEPPPVEPASRAANAPAVALPADEPAVVDASAPARGRITEARRAGRAADARPVLPADAWPKATADSAITPTARGVVAQSAIGDAAHAATTQADPRPAAPHSAASLLPPVVDAPWLPKAVADVSVHDATAGDAPAVADEPALADQIVQSLRLQLTSGGGEAQLRLRPEYLGELTVKVVVLDGVVSARLEAAAPAVRDWVERHEGVLRQALADHGLSLDTLSVHESAPSDDANQTFERNSSRGEPDERERPRRRRRSDGAWGRFVVDTDESDAS